MRPFLSRLAPNSDFDAPSPIYSFLTAPVAFTARRIYKTILLLRPHPAAAPNKIRVVCISDTHTKTTDIPNGDLLIHAGDLTNAGTIEEIQAQIDWLHSLPHPRKIAIAGNHDTFLDARSRKTLPERGRSGKLDWRGIEYLQHSSIDVEFPSKGNRKLNIYGAPQIPGCGGSEFAFQYQRRKDAWSSTVPIETDILVTHTPPKWHLDLPIGLGCEWLLSESWRVKPKLHVFGHVHAGHGSETVWWGDCQAAYERICERDDGSLINLVKPSNWIDLARLCLFGGRDVIWSVLWGGEAYGGVMVNSALMSQVTGQLVYKPQVVEI